MEVLTVEQLESNVGGLKVFGGNYGVDVMNAAVDYVNAESSLEARAGAIGSVAGMLTSYLLPETGVGVLLDFGGLPELVSEGTKDSLLAAVKFYEYTPMGSYMLSGDVYTPHYAAPAFTLPNLSGVYNGNSNNCGSSGVTVDIGSLTQPANICLGPISFPQINFTDSTHGFDIFINDMNPIQGGG